MAQQSDLEFLRFICATIDAVVHLEGNCGKRVRKVLERWFPKGTFDVVVPVSEGMSTFRFACHLGDVEFGCELANEAAYDVHEQVHFSVTAEDSWKEYRLRAEVKIPETVRARQKFLRNFSYLLCRVSASICQELRGPAHERFFTHLFEGVAEEDTEENRTRAIRQFEALTSFDYREVLDAPTMIVLLAGRLEPDVYKAMRTFSEERERQSHVVAA